MPANSRSRWSRVALVLGASSLLPCAAPILVLPALVSAAVAFAVSFGHPECRNERIKAVFAALISVAGLLVFVAESGAFLTWKRYQAQGQRRAVTVIRMKDLAAALERFRAKNGRYPEVETAGGLCSILVPEYLDQCPAQDGWGRDFQVHSEVRTYRITIVPLETEKEGSRRKAPGYK